LSLFTVLTGIHSPHFISVPGQTPQWLGKIDSHRKRDSKKILNEKQSRVIKRTEKTDKIKRGGNTKKQRYQACLQTHP